MENTIHGNTNANVHRNLWIINQLWFQKKNKKGAFLLIISVIIIFLMVGLSGSDMSIAIQWIAEIINTLGQFSFLLAGITFTKELE